MKQYSRLSDIQEDLRSKAVSVQDLVNDYLDRISEQEHLNAFLEVFDEDARAAAKALDEKLQSGQEPGPLFGMVIAIKDNICYKGHKVSASSKLLGDFESIYSATVVERLEAADAIIIGRTNCDEFAMGSSNENSAFGPVKNPIDESLVPGGSSGGSAAAVKANLCLAALGSDTGGSIRQPASFCDVVGFKPTYGRVSRYGLIAYASSFDQIGPITHSIEDAEAIYRVIAGNDEMDATSSKKPLPESPDSEDSKKFAMIRSIAEHEGLSPEVKAFSEQWVKDLESAGHSVELIDFPYLDYLIPTYYVLSTAEASSNLSRFDGMRYGFRHPEAHDMEEVYTMSRSEGFGHEVKNRIMTGTFVLSSGYYDAFYSKAQKVRRLLVDEVNRIFNEYDFIINPTAPELPFRFGAKSDDPVSMYLSDIYTVLANLTGTPAISLPLYRTESGLPAGMQLMGPRFSDEHLLSFASSLMVK